MLAKVIPLKYLESQDYGRDFRSRRNLWKRKRKSCRDFCEFIREVKSSDLMTLYLFALAFSSLFDLWVLQAFPILIYHLFVVNTLRAFKSRLVKRISVFRLIVFFHCDITKGTTARAVISQSDGSARSGLFVFWLVPLACEKEMIARLTKEDLTRHFFFVKKRETPSLPSSPYQTLS